MNPERWKKIEDVFQSALDLTNGEREEFLRSECGDDSELRREVEKLIARYETEESFLESPVWTDSVLMQPSLKQQIAGSLEEEISPSAVFREEKQSFVGRQVGAYRLTEELGKGGMGVVYLAERDDGEFYQKVAVKLIKRGMDTDFIVKRFRHERQIAATLNHPNIARLLDGGTTADDLPYFVMEFVEGAPFFRYSEARRLDLKAKLNLFLQVCAAISYAHGKGIIHRDIKPGNILVTDEGEPKLLDFGIAKILDPDLIHEPLMPTWTQMRLMTPEYASPEQVRGDEITPASDQYSLGVLLYELLTGHRPYKFPSRAPHEIARIICEEMPSEPSSGEFGKMTTGDLILGKDFCQKLDRIVLKSLRKNSLERYTSVKDFAADIKRFLRNEPVLAESFAGEKEASEIGREMVKPSPAPAAQKSIAVLPFKILKTLSEAQDTDEFLEIGLADALITRLSGVRRFAVRPTSSVLRFSNADVDSFAAARELAVDFILEGTIMRRGNRIRVSVQLLDARQKLTVWAERFDEDSTDVLELEDQISARAAESLVPQMSGEERRHLEKRGTDDRQAYEAFLRGRVHWNTYTEAGFRRAYLFYQEAVNFDSRYAAAHAAIADYYVWIGVFGSLPAREAFPAAKRAALRAVELDDESSEAYASLGAATLYGEYDWRAGEQYVRRAIEINPNNAVARVWLSHHLNLQRRFDEAQENSRRAAEIDSVSFEPLNELAWDFYFARRFDDALATIARVIEKFPSFGASYFGQSNFLRIVGRFEESLEASLRAVEMAGDTSTLLYGHAQALAAAGKTAEAENFLDKIKAQMTQHAVSFYQTAVVYCWSNEPEKAVNALEKSLEDREGMVLYFLVEPAFDRFRDDARFVEFAAKLDFTGLKSWRPEASRASPTTGKEKSKSPASRLAQKSIAVLPFKFLDTLGGAATTGGDGFLGIGLADALITRLSNVRQFLVRPTSSILSYGERAVDSFAAGDELKVQYVLDGSIIKTAKRIRVSVQLLNVAAQITVWAERFDEDLTDVLNLEDSISKRVAESLVPQLTAGEKQNLSKRGTDDAGAYEAYLRGRFHRNTFTEEGFRQAISFYEKAIELDPNYALAHAAIADYYVWLGIYGTVSPNECYPPAKAAAIRAIEIDDKLAEAHGALGLARLYGDYDWEQSEKDILRAVELNPNNPVAHLWYSHNLFTQGRFAEGQPHVERAVELDPLTFQNHNTLAWSYFLTRRFDDALRKVEDVIERFPAISQSYFSKAHYLNRVGRTDEAMIEIKRALALSDDSLFTIHGLATTLAAAGERQAAVELVEKTEAESGTKYFSYYQVALVYCYLKDKDKAFEYLTRAYENRETLLVWVGVEPSLDAIRDDGRYVAFLRKINHPTLKTIYKNPTEQRTLIKGSNRSIETSAAVLPMPTTERIVWSRRAGIKQGAFVMIVSVLSLPLLVMMLISVSRIVPPILLIFVFLLGFFGGLVRIIYAIFFEPKAAFAPGDSSPDLEVSFSSRPTLVVEGEETDAKNLVAASEPKRRFSKKSVLFALAAVSLLAFGYALYHVVSHSKIDFSTTPPNERWKDNFAAKMTAKRLTTSGKARQAVLSPDGGNVAYIYEDGGRRSLWIRATDSENARQLVAPDAVFYTELKFSPGGDYVYYIHSRAPARTLYRVSVNGGAPEKISGNVQNLFALAPDGRRIVYDSRNADNNQHSLFIAELGENAQIKSARTLVVLEMPNYFPGGISFSPDGEKIVYPRSVIENNREVVNLFVHDLTTNRSERFGDKNFDRINAAEWRRYGEEIVISAKESDSATHQLWVVAYPSGEVSRLTNDFTDYYGVSLTADSATLATTKIDLISDIWTGELAASGVNFDSKTKQITHGVDRQNGFNGVSWTKDGRILYTTGAGAERGISLMNHDGTNSRLIPTGALDPKFPTLTGDNRFLVYADKKGQELNIWRFDMTAGTSARISSRYAVTPAVSPDDRAMVYAMLSDSSSNRLVIHRQPLAGGEEISLTSDTSVRPVVSPDGRFVACNYAGEETNKIWQIAVLPMEAGASAPKFIQPYKNNFFVSPQERALAWSPDGRFLYFLNNADNVANIFRVAAEGDSAPIQMTHFTSGEIFDFAISPDGKRAALARGSTSSDAVIFRSSK